MYEDRSNEICKDFCSVSERDGRNKSSFSRKMQRDNKKGILRLLLVLAMFPSWMFVSSTRIYEELLRVKSGMEFSD